MALRFNWAGAEKSEKASALRRKAESRDRRSEVGGQRSEPQNEWSGVYRSGKEPCAVAGLDYVIDSVPIQ